MDCKAVPKDFSNVGFRKRSKWEIIYQILNTLEKGEYRKTRIGHAVCLDWKLLKKYLEFLNSCDLIRMHDGRCIITNKGKKFLMLYRELIKLFDGKIEK